MRTAIVMGIVLLYLGLMFQYPHVMLNPGQLTKGHQRIKEKCFSCHTPFQGIDNKKCISCHKLSEIGKDTNIEGDLVGAKNKILFHAGLATQKCSACHTDHKGVNPVTSLSSFNHEMLETANRNNCVSCHNKPQDKLHRLLSVACINCHNTEGWKSATKFDHNMIQGQDKNNCKSCHEPPKDNYHQMVKDNCNKCHGTDKWVPSTFDHSVYFRLDSDHNVSCATCHKNNNYSTFTCYGCHEHTESNIRGEHNEEGIYNFTNCASCHKSADEHDIRMNGDNTNDLKTKSGGKKDGNRHSNEENDD